jgi:hypothetical protein
MDGNSTIIGFRNLVERGGAEKGEGNMHTARSLLETSTSTPIAQPPTIHIG